LTDAAREIRERYGPLWVVQFNEGPMDGHLEIHTKLARRVYRRWFPMNREGPPRANVYEYALVEPITGASETGEVAEPLQYVLVDIQPHDPIQPPTPE
jgi:hypothetical protein